MTDEELIAEARKGISPFLTKRQGAKPEEVVPYAIRETVVVYFEKPGLNGSYEITLDKETGRFMNGSFMPEEPPYVRDPERMEKHSLAKRKKRNSNGG